MMYLAWWSEYLRSLNELLGVPGRSELLRDRIQTLYLRQHAIPEARIYQFKGVA